MDVGTVASKTNKKSRKLAKTFKIYAYAQTELFTPKVYLDGG